MILGRKRTYVASVVGVLVANEELRMYFFAATRKRDHLLGLSFRTYQKKINYDLHFSTFLHGLGAISVCYFCFDLFVCFCFVLVLEIMSILTRTCVTQMKTTRKDLHSLR